MNSYVKEIDNCFNCDAEKMMFTTDLYQISCKECGDRPIKIKTFGDTNVPIPDWCPRLKEKKIAITQEEFKELQRYREMILDDLK